MRRWGLIVVVSLAVVGGLVGFALFNVDRYLNENRDWIASRVESATGRRVSFGEIGLSLWGGVGAAVSELTIADDPAYSDEPFLRADLVRVQVALWPALFGRIEVREIVLEAPTIRLIRTASGMNFDSIGSTAADEEAPPARSSGDAGDEAAAGAPALGLIIALLSIEDGQVEYIDRAVAPPSTTVVRQIDLRVTGVGEPKLATVDFAAALFESPEPNLRLAGELGPLTLGAVEGETPIDLALELRVGPAALAVGGRVHAGPPVDVRVKVDGDDVPLAGWSDLVPALRAYELGGRVDVHASVEGKVAGKSLPVVQGKVVVSEGSFRATTSADEADGIAAELELEGTTNARGEVRVARGTIQNAPFENLRMKIAVEDDVARLDGLELAAFDGTLRGSGRYDFRKADDPRFDFRQELSELDVDAMLQSQIPSAEGRMTGRLSGSLQVAGGGPNEDAIRASLRGNGSLDVADGVLVGVNLPEAILQSVTGIEGLTTLLSPDLREKYVDVLTAHDTAFEEMSTSIEIANQEVTTSDTVVAARDYALRGEGRMDFDGRLDFTASLVASERLTGDVVERVREARYITNADGRLEIPAKIVGVLPDVKVEPDAAFLARSLTKGALGKGLELLGGGTPGDEAEDGATGEVDGPPERKRPEEVGADLIEKGLRGLFGDGRSPARR